MATTHATQGSKEAEILARMIRPDKRDLPGAAARALLRLKFDQSDLDRMHELAVMNQDDALTPADKADLESYLRVSYFIDLVHAKARCSLKKHR